MEKSIGRAASLGRVASGSGNCSRSRAVREARVLVLELHEGKTDLPCIVHRFGLVGLLALTNNHRSSETCQSGDDDDDDEKLHQREATTNSWILFHRFVLFMLCL